MKGAQKSSPNRATNTKLTDATTDHELMDIPNADLMSTNEKLIETNVLNVLGMTLEEVQVLKQLIYERMNNESPDDIYVAISKLGGRNRKNKTLYISEGITNNVQEFCDNRGIKLSSFVEIAMIEAMMKYK